MPKLPKFSPYEAVMVVVLLPTVGFIAVMNYYNHIQDGEQKGQINENHNKINHVERQHNKELAEMKAQHAHELHELKQQHRAQLEALSERVEFLVRKLIGRVRPPDEKMIFSFYYHDCPDMPGVWYAPMPILAKSDRRCSWVRLTSGMGQPKRFRT